MSLLDQVFEAYLEEIESTNEQLVKEEKPVITLSQIVETEKHICDLFMIYFANLMTLTSLV
jgi:hypothetical protein